MAIPKTIPRIWEGYDEEACVTSAVEPHDGSAMVLFMLPLPALEAPQRDVIV